MTLFSLVQKNNKKSISRGFTLVELMVSISLYSIVMLISMGAILSILNANRKSQALRSVMDNLNFSLEGMTKTIRFAEAYHCGTTGSLSAPQDCSTGSSLTVTTDPSLGTQVTYSQIGSQIYRTTGVTTLPITSDDVLIQSLNFVVIGSYPYSGVGITDKIQPRVMIVVRGLVAGQNGTGASFTLQTTASQRKLDFQ